MAQAVYTEVTKTPGATKPGWTMNRLFVVLGAATLVAAIFFEFGLNIGPEIAPGVPGIVLAIVLVFANAAWIYLAAGILLSVLPLMVLFLFGALEGIADPTAGRSYASLMMLILTLLFALPAGIRGFMERRKGGGVHVTGTLQSKWGAVTVAIALVLLGAGVAGLAAGHVAKEKAASGGGYDNIVAASTVPVTMKDFAFVPVDVPVASGQIVEFVVTNEDTTFHTFTYELGGTTYNHDVPSGVTTKFLAQFDGPGTIPYWCNPHSSGKPAAEGDEEMRGTLTVS